MRNNVNVIALALIALCGTAAAHTLSFTPPTTPTAPATTKTIGGQSVVKQPTIRIQNKQIHQVANLPAVITNKNTPVQPTKNGPIAQTPGTQGNRPVGIQSGTQFAKQNLARVDAFPAFAASQRPSKQHLDLTLSFLGEWTTTTNAWNAPNAAPSTSTGRARFFPTMGGRFVCGDVEGELFGKQFKSMGFMGFNTTQNRYEASWVNTENTDIANYNGQKVGDNGFAWTGTVTSPITGQPGTSRGTTTFNGKETFTYTLFTTGTDGNEFKVYETTYNRVSLGGPFAIRPVYGNNGASANVGTGQNGTQASTQFGVQNQTFYPVKAKATTRTTSVSDQPSIATDK